MRNISDVCSDTNSMWYRAAGMETVLVQTGCCTQSLMLPSLTQHDMQQIMLPEAARTGLSADSDRIDLGDSPDAITDLVISSMNFMPQENTSTVACWEDDMSAGSSTTVQHQFLLTCHPPSMYLARHVPAKKACPFLDDSMRRG